MVSFQGNNMTTFTTQDRLEAEMEPIPFAGMVKLQDQEDKEEMLREQIHILHAECQRLRKRLREIGENDWIHMVLLKPRPL